MRFHKTLSFFCVENEIIKWKMVQYEMLPFLALSSQSIISQTRQKQNKKRSKLIILSGRKKTFFSVQLIKLFTKQQVWERDVTIWWVKSSTHPYQMKLNPCLSSNNSQFWKKNIFINMSELSLKDFWWSCIITICTLCYCHLALWSLNKKLRPTATEK